MSRAVSVVAIVLVILAASSSMPRPSTAISGQPNWPPLSETCYDVTGDGKVELFADILGVMSHFGARWGDPNYALVYDVGGGGTIELFDDILRTISAFNTTCSLIDTQVVQATLAVMKYQDQSVALADGYVPVTQNIFGHGIHWLKGSLMDEVFDLTEPEGLNYSLDGELLAVYYIDPLWLPGHEQEPEGFDGPEDNAPMGWHDHPGLCSWQGASGPMVAEYVEQADCLSRPGGAWFESFGWMVHLWNFLPNAAGRFVMHNDAAG